MIEDKIIITIKDNKSQVTKQIEIDYRISIGKVKRKMLKLLAEVIIEKDEIKITKP